MKTSVLLPFLLLCAAAAPVLAQDDEASGARFGGAIRFGGVIFDKDCWDDSVGAACDFGLTVWEPEGIFGLWAGLGGQSASYVWEDDWGEVESDVVAVPVGASLLARLELTDRVALRGEIGARYVAMDIDDWDDDRHDHRRRRRYDDRDRYYNPDRYLDVDDTSFAVVSLQLEFGLHPAFLAVGGGYQFDLEKPDVEYMHRALGKVDLSGAFLYLAFGVEF